MKFEFLQNLSMMEKSFTNENRESASRILKMLNKGGLCYPKDELRDFGVTILNMNIGACGYGEISIVHDILQRHLRTQEETGLSDLKH